MDVSWLTIWGGIFWRDKKYFPDGYWANTIHKLVSIISAVNIILKVRTSFASHFIDCHYIDQFPVLEDFKRTEIMDRLGFKEAMIDLKVIDVHYKVYNNISMKIIISPSLTD